MSKSTFIRHATYEMEGGDKVLRIKKWSASKFISIVSEIADVIDDAMASLDGQTISREKLYTRLTVSFSRSMGKLSWIIRESVESPKLTDEAIGEWDIEDLLGCLAEIFKLNLTEALQKKAMGLLMSAIPGSRALEEAENSLETKNGKADNGVGTTPSPSEPAKPEPASAASSRT